MPLLLQLDGNLPKDFPDDERRLYIFHCPRKPCSRKAGSVRALRGVRKWKPKEQTEQEQIEAPKQTKTDLGSAIFGAPSTNDGSSNANPFSVSQPSSSLSNPFATQSSASNSTSSKQTTDDLPKTFAEKARIASPDPAQSAPSPAPVAAGPVLPWPPQAAFPPPYPEYYLNAEYETLSRPPSPTIPPNAIIEPMDEEDGPSTSKKGNDIPTDKAEFESSLDKVFLRFSTRLAHNPEQVLRYEYRGTPLLYSGNDDVAKAFPQQHSQRVASTAQNRIPRCQACGSERVFELQLVPHAISVLEEGREDIGPGKDDAGMEWGTIILGVCAANCGPATEGQAGWREEWVGVQWEETR